MAKKNKGIIISSSNNQSDNTSCSPVPESAIDSVTTTLSNLRHFKSHFHQFLSLSSDPLLLSQLSPLQRAHSLFFLAKITSTLLTLKLRCNGVEPDDHPIKSELDRLEVYQNKLERLMDLSRAPLRPSATLNYQAATRFIEHSLPDLTPEQRQNMRTISKGEGPKTSRHERAGQKRKHESSGKQSVKNAAKEFLEKAAREILGNNNGGMKGPLRIDMSDEEDDDDEQPVL